MGLRTEDLSLANAEDNKSSGLTYKVEGVIKVAEPLGSETNMHMDLQGADLVVKSEGRRLFNAGEKLQITLNLAHLHIFDAESEKSIY